MLQTFLLSACKSVVCREISLTDLFCLEILFVAVCERLYPRFHFGYLFRFFYFHLQKCRRKLNFSREEGEEAVNFSQCYVCQCSK